jgi:hypothetical protein
MKALKEVTPEQAREIVRHYKKQGVTDLDLQPRDAAAIVPGQGPAVLEIEWKLWFSGKGFVASYGNYSQAFPDCATREKMKALRFRGEKLPLRFFEPWRTLLALAVFPVRLFLNRFAPAQSAARVIEI